MSAGRFWVRPDVNRLTALSITTLFWIAWFYLITPLLSLVMWLAGIKLFVDEMLVQDGYVSLLVELRTYGMIILAILLIMLVWIDWNLRRYGHHEQRHQQPVPVSKQEMAQHSGMTEENLAALHDSRNATVDYDEEDRLLVTGIRH